MKLPKGVTKQVPSMWVAVQSHSDRTRHRERRGTEGPPPEQLRGGLRYDTERIPLHAHQCSNKWHRVKYTFCGMWFGPEVLLVTTAYSLWRVMARDWC